jgi:hypothetical protein
MLAGHIELILWVTGLATIGAVVVLLAPVPVMKAVFGQVPPDELSLLIARHWGLLVSLVGALLMYAAYHAEVRVPVLTVAIVEKVVIVLGLLLSSFRRRALVLVMVLGDMSMAVVYLFYLAGF